MSKIYAYFVLSLFASTLTACAATPQIQIAADLFHDQHFSASTEVIDASEIFRANMAMKQFIADEIQRQSKSASQQRSLFNALHSKAKLKLEYESSITRTAAETFDSRSGNCLSLVIMTAALAKQLGLTVEFQKVIVGEDWSRAGELYFASGHVNIVLGRKRFDETNYRDAEGQMVIDFLPPEDIRGQRTLEISENTVIAMYMNNRAAEALVRNKIDQAYWWARAAIETDREFPYPYNTLGVIYMRSQLYEHAQRALTVAMQLDSNSTVAMSNMIPTLSALGKHTEASNLHQQLISKQPFPPFHFFQLGIKAMDRNDFEEAKSLFKKELSRAPDYHEFHFWLGLAYLRLGEIEAAQKELARAKESSVTQKDFALYAAKLDRLRSITQKN
jgi:Flp pilus assembly protein TadD